MIFVTLDLGDIFYFFFNSAGISTRCKGVMAITTFLALLIPKTSLLMVLVLLASLALGGGRLLVLATRNISRKGVSGLRSFGVLFLLFSRLVPLEIPEIYLAGT